MNELGRLIDRHGPRDVRSKGATVFRAAQVLGLYSIVWDCGLVDILRPGARSLIAYVVSAWYVWICSGIYEVNSGALPKKRFPYHVLSPITVHHPQTMPEYDINKIYLRILLEQSSTFDKLFPNDSD